MCRKHIALGSHRLWRECALSVVNDDNRLACRQVRCCTTFVYSHLSHMEKQRAFKHAESADFLFSLKANWGLTSLFTYDERVRNDKYTQTKTVRAAAGQRFSRFL